MALTGTLRDFGIAEILQLIGTQKKTGLLSVEDGKRRAQIEFADGMVVGASGGEETASLEERLVGGGVLSQEQVDTATRRVRETLKPLPSVLISEGYIDPEAMREIAVRHISEIVYEVFDWKSGTYAFQQKFPQWDKQIVTPIPAESIMMEGLRIVDEGPGIRKVLSNLDDVYDRVVRSYEEVEQLDPEAKCLYEAVDGRSTLKDIILASNQTKFDAMKHLAWMRMNRFILKQENRVAVEAPAKKQPQRLNAPTMVALYILLAVTAAALAIKAGQAVWTLAAPLANYEETSNPAPAMIEQARLSRIHSALKVYHLRHGAYPERIEFLIEENLLRHSDVRPMGREPFPYLPLDSGSQYLLGDKAKAALAASENPAQ